MHGVHFVDGKRGWAVGTEGLVLSTTDGGLTWTEQSPKKAISRHPLNKVTFFYCHQRLGGKPMGEVHYTGSSGKSWSKQATPVDKGLLDIQFANATEGWAIGGYGTILHTDGWGWTLGEATNIFEFTSLGSAFRGQSERMGCRREGSHRLHTERRKELVGATEQHRTTASRRLLH